jgi:hypothetical protein
MWKIVPFRDYCKVVWNVEIDKSNSEQSSVSWNEHQMPTIATNQHPKVTSGRNFTKTQNKRIRETHHCVFFSQPKKIISDTETISGQDTNLVWHSELEGDHRQTAGGWYFPRGYRLSHWYLAQLYWPCETNPVLRVRKTVKAQKVRDSKSRICLGLGWSDALEIEHINSVS